MKHLLEEGLAEFATFATSEHALLALDFDGTLSSLVLDPQSARIHRGAREALERLSRGRTRGLRIGVVSGRRLSDLAARVPPVDVLIGLHGIEIAFAGEPSRLRFDLGDSDRALERLRGRLGRVDLGSARIEDKGHSITLHVRGVGAAPSARALADFESAVEGEISAGAPLRCLRGHLSAEARPACAGKHLAIAEAMEKFEATALAYVGDDATDEEVFIAYPKQFGVVVMDPPRESRARFRLRSPEEVSALLERIATLRG